MKKSNIISAVISLVLVAAISVGATIAYLSSQATTTGSFNFGDVGFAFEGGQPALQGILDAEVFMPGKTSTLDLSPLIKMQDDSQDAYLRVRVELDNYFATSVGLTGFTVSPGWTIAPNNYGNMDPSVFYLIHNGPISYADTTSGFVPLSFTVKPPSSFTFEYPEGYVLTGRVKTDMSISVEAIQTEGFENNQQGAFDALTAAIAK